MATSRMVERSVTPPRDAGETRRQRLGVAMVATLLAQTVLGVANELWTTLPDSGDAFAAASPKWLLSLHVLVGSVAIVVAAILSVSARRARDRAWTGPALVGLLAVLGAWLSGHFFLVTFGADALSLSMATLGVVALAAYVTGLVRATGATLGRSDPGPGATSHLEATT